MSAISIHTSFKQALIGGTALIACLASPAWAAADDAKSGANSGDIIVTAQRRSERLVDVPMSVVAVTAENVAKAGVVNIHDINRLAAGVQMNFAGCCTQPAVRGISTLTTGVGFENNVAIYIDGFYAPDNLSINGDMGNLSSIEVLKGPQGTLWGRNATGGAILMNTKSPSDVLTGKVELGAARFNELSVSGYLSGPLSKSVRASISGYNRSSNGFYTQVVNTAKLGTNAAPQRQSSVRAKLEADLGENTKATLGANFAYSSDARGVIFTVTGNPSATYITSATSFGRATEPRTASGAVLSEASAEVREGTLKLEHKASFGTITSYTGYAERKNHLLYDFSTRPEAPLISDGSSWSQKTYQQTIDANITSIDKLNLVIGASYYHDTDYNPNQFGFNYVSRTSTLLRATALAGYIDATFHLTDQLVLNAGARYTHESKSIAFTRFGGTPFTTVTFGPFDQGVSYNAFTPKASLRYEISPRTNVYASFSRGFRNGGFNPNGGDLVAGALASYNPETVSSYELGFKTSNPTFQFEAAGFYYDYKNLQVGITSVAPVLINTVYNAPTAKVYGLDAMLSVHPTESLNAKIGVAYLHGRYGDFPLAQGNAINAAGTANLGNVPQNWIDQQMARAPTFSGNASVDYTFENFAGGKLNTGGSLVFTSSFVPNNPSLYGSTNAALGAITGPLATTQRYKQGAYATLNVQATWSTNDDAYKITLYVNNVTNKSYRESYSGNGSGDYSAWSQPVTAGARLSAQF